MRISPVGWVADSEQEVKYLSRVLTEISHNHPEGIKGAEAIAMAVYLARIGKSKIVFGLTFCLFRFVLIIGYVPSASMEPTLKEKSYILGVRIHGDLKVGDIIIFEHEGSTMVKRIAAVGGEIIESDGKIYTVPKGRHKRKRFGYRLH